MSGCVGQANDEFSPSRFFRRMNKELVKFVPLRYGGDIGKLPADKCFCDWAEHALRPVTDMTNDAQSVDKAHAFSRRHRAPIPRRRRYRGTRLYPFERQSGQWRCHFVYPSEQTIPCDFSRSDADTHSRQIRVLLYSSLERVDLVEKGKRSCHGIDRRFALCSPNLVRRY